MKRIYIILFFVMPCVVVQSQNAQGYLGNYAQPAPDAASLGKYVDYPIGYYTGTPDINIPLYQLSDGAVKIPISLSYHPSGIRVSELATWVGLGWNLNATGMIIRTVRGAPDEGGPNTQTNPSGYYVDSGLKKVPTILPYPVNGSIPGGDYWSNKRYTFLSAIPTGGGDSEPDLFTFNFNGYSGKFVFDEYRTPQLLSKQDIKIKVNYSSGAFQSWVITTPDGAMYYFGENNMHEQNAVYSSTGGEDINTHVPSSWYLTKIIYPNSKDTVQFAYTAEAYRYCDLGQETALFDQMSGDKGVHAACINATQPPANSLRTTVSGYRLSSITTHNYTVSFIAKTTRLDLDTSGYDPLPRRLDSVKVFNSQNQCIKQFYLAYDYFRSTKATKASVAALQITDGEALDTLRLKLLSVKEFSGDGTISKPPYVFSYNETYQLPRRMSYDQDHWGFSNYATGNRNDRFTPQVDHSICISPGGTGISANRDPSWPSMQAFSITAITDPLGVVTSFEFEPHSSLLIGGTNMVGGLRIHKIKTLDNVTGDSTIRLFDYGNGGVVYNIPKYLIEPHNEYYPDMMNLSFFSYVGTNFSEFQSLRCLLRQSQSVVPLQDFQGNHIGYGLVKEIFGPHGEGGYKIHRFMADQILSTSRLSIDNYASTATVLNGASDGQYTYRTGLFGNGKFEQQPPVAPETLTYASSYTANNYWPLAPLQVDFRRGQALGEDTYDSSGNVITSVSNIYSETYDETKQIRGFKLFKSSQTADPSAGPQYYYAMTFYKLHTGISHLMETVTKNYKDGKTFVSDTRYGYESVYHTQKTSDTTVNSQGDSLISKTYYSFDYANSATTDGVFTKLKARNMLLPVSQRVWKNNRLFGGTITLFKDFAGSSVDTLINPYKVYSLEINNTLTTSQAGESIKLTGLLSTLVPNTYFHEKAIFNYNGTTGKISEQNLSYDKKQALIWDNQLSLPLAVVDNASASDIAYNSFETAETGNWTFTAGSKATDASTPLGGKVYTLSSGNPLSKTVTSGAKYIVSYWLKSGASASVTGGTLSNNVTGATATTTAAWTFHQVMVTASSSTISITGSGNIDEVRLYPATAQMISYTYDSLLRLVDQCSANGSFNQYEYDSFNRLVDIKDQFGNVVKAFEYNYGGLAR